MVEAAVTADNTCDTKPLRVGLDIGSTTVKAVVLDQTDSLDAAMQAARKASRPGDVVLLSPACASFDLFKNYENRGELFKQWVAEHAK